MGPGHVFDGALLLRVALCAVCVGACGPAISTPVDASKDVTLQEDAEASTESDVSVNDVALTDLSETEASIEDVAADTPLFDAALADVPLLDAGPIDVPSFDAALADMPLLDAGLVDMPTSDNTPRTDSAPRPDIVVTFDMPSVDVPQRDVAPPLDVSVVDAPPRDVAPPPDMPIVDVPRMVMSTPRGRRELAFVRAAGDRYLTAAGLFAARRDDLIAYHRTTCSQAIMSGVLARAGMRTIATNDVGIVALREAAPVLASITGSLSANNHVKLAMPLDCALGAALLWPWMPASDRSALVAGLRAVADDAFGTSPASGWATTAFYAARQRGNLGDSQTEEAGVAAGLAHVLVELLPAPREHWLGRARELTAYTLQTGDQRVDGSPFPRSGATANHQMRPNPYYTPAALISLADATAVRQQLRGDLALPMLSATRVSEVLRSIAPMLDAHFRFQGAWEAVSLTGDVIPGEGRRFEAMSRTLANYPAGWDLQAPVDSVGPGAPSGRGTLNEFWWAARGEHYGYQTNATEVRTWRCAPRFYRDSRGATYPRCEANARRSLADQWSSLAQAAVVYGSTPPPTDRLDAWATWFTSDGTLRSRIIRGDRFWEYRCTAGGSCTAERTTTLAAHFATLGDPLGAWSIAPPTTQLDAFSAYQDAAGIRRLYYWSGNRVWHERCDAAGTCVKQYTRTLAELFSSVTGSFGREGLPTDRVDAVTQYVAEDGNLRVIVLRGDRTWTYQCTATGCSALATATLTERWRSIVSQERLARSTFETRSGVTDWGVDGASVFNSAWALSAVLGDRISLETYDRLLNEQEARGLAMHPLLPSTHDASGWSWGPFAGAFDGTRAPRGLLWYLADGWWPGFYCVIYELCAPSAPTLPDQLNSNAWMNVFAARTHAIAWLLQTPERVIDVLR